MGIPGPIPKDFYDCGKIFLNHQTNKSWLKKSGFVVSAVGLTAKFWMTCFTSVRVHNRSSLIKALEDRKEGVPLISVANHHSCMDEPLLWGILDAKHLINQKLMRWAIAAHDICFSRKLHSDFFAYGKSIPVERGAGVFQKGMDFCLDRVNDGSWIHLYPEGKVNMTPEIDLRFKWGIGRLINEAKITPIVIPIYHLGMDKLLPSVKPYIPRPFKKVTIVVGDPIDIDSFMKNNIWTSELQKRKAITDFIQLKLRDLRTKAEMLHVKKSIS